jgi:FlaA1/EpsC-like NDP-sugar epimerase
MKTVLVTGAAGSIGSELCRQLSKKYKVIALDQDESRLFDLHQELPSIEPVIADIRDMERIGRVLANHKPVAIYHAAAYKHVPLMEKYPREGWKTNVIGFMNVALNAVYFGVEKVIFISSDKAVNPSNQMGKTKAMGEHICKQLNDNKTTFISVRFGNVLASRGSVVPLFTKQIEQGEVRVTHPDMTRYFMTIPDACELITKAAKIGKGGEIYLLDMGEPVKIMDLAKTMIQISGKRVPIKITGTRPGEKLTEELYDSKKEKLIKTKYPNISQVVCK